jgi:hypothetical protein
LKKREKPPKVVISEEGVNHSIYFSHRMCIMKLLQGLLPFQLIEALMDIQLYDGIN